MNTGGYTSYGTTTWYSVSPYGSEFWMHDGEVISLAISDDGEMQGVEIGYFYGAYLLPNIQNSTLSGISSIASSHGYKYNNYYNWEADMFTVKNSTITHFRAKENTGSVAYEDMCFIVAGSNVLIEGNTISNCAVGVFLQRTPYYYSHNSTYWGADDAVIKDNTFKDSETIDVWFYLNSNTEGAEIIGNTFTGSSSPSYSIYTQDSTTSDLLIDGNTFSNADEAIYMRGATDWTITDNTITGKGDAALAGIYVKDGYGVIDGNDLTDADGGILVDGLKYGYEANVTNNNIGQTSGRVAPAAVGIWAEDCGSNQVNTGGNTIEVMENAIVTDGCDLTDSGSTLIAIGGSGGSVSSIQINANAYSPASLSIDTGDTIRWRANEYSSTGQPHTVTSNDTDSGGMALWGSGGNMNLGSTYTRTFNTEGTFEYHCSTHTWMTGVITVSNGTSGTISSVGFSVAGGTDEIILDGTTISGFGIAIEQYGGDMTLSGDATLNGGSYAVYAEDTDVIVDGASLSASSTGSALYIFGASSLDANDMDTAGLYGINTNAVDFRWNYGNSVATTAVMADGGAEGSVENVTWADSTTEIDAGSYVTITSVGNSLTASKLIVDPTAVIHEGNLLNLNVTHKGGDASDVGLMIKSTDSAQAAYVSPAYRAPYVSADGDLSEWIGNALNPSDDAMPGVMSGDGSEDFLATWDANNLYMALTGVDMASADLQIYIDSSTGGETTGQSWYVAHSLPFAADYVYWAEDGDSANSGLKVNGFTGWADVTSSCSGLNDHVGYSGDTDTEISIPWDCIGNPSDTVRIIVIVQNESDGGIASVHPSQTVTADGNAQSFNDEITLMMGGSDLVAGDDLRDHLLIFRSYVGSNSPSDAKTYDLSVLVDATCEKDWGLIEDVDMSTNTWETINVERACPAISSLVDIKVNEDEGTYVLTLDDKATDVQDDDATLTWAVSDDADPTNSPSMLLNSALNVNDQEMTITPDNDQFGSYMFHYTVTDSNGLSDSTTIVFTVVNVNDAPIICNTERSDCMPVFADDGADNLNVLDEGFGSVSKVLGSAANATGSYVIDMASNDMANEQPQVYSWSAKIKGDDVTVDAYWVQKQYSSVAAMFDEVGAVITNNGGAQDIDMTGDPSGHEDTDITYTLPTLNNVSLLTYLLAQNGCGSVWYQEYMDSAGNKVTGVRSDDGCDSTIDTYGNVYSGLNYTQFWDVAYGVDVSTFSAGWDDVFANGYTTTAGNNPCVAFGVGVTNNELTITEDTTNELGGECTIVLSLQDDGGYCSNLYMGRTTNAKASCVAYTWLINYPVNHPVYGPITVTGCYNLYLGLPSFIPEYYPTGQATGMTSAICLAYSWNAENINAQDFEVNFSVTPVNDAPEVLDWDRQAGINIVAGNGSVPNFPWKVTLTEDDETLENLVYDLSAMKADADHADEDLVWSIVKATNCDYEEYFSATINDDDITFDLIKDATTNAPEWEVDYLNNGGRHQQTPLSGEFCPIILYLHDSASAPDAIPNYGMPTADYQQGEDSVTIYVRVQNVAENVPDYFMKDGPGFDFNGVTNIMTKTYVPTTVKIGHGGDEGPYNYDHMLQVTFMTNGYNNDEPDLEGYITLGTQYVSPPAYGEEISVSDKIFVTSTSTKVWATVDVLTCVDATCDMSKSAGDRFFGHSFPEAHRCIDSNDVQGEAWSCPGEVGRSSVDADGQPLSAVKKNNRRPMLEDQAWCNNIMSSEESGSDCAQPRTFGEVTLASNQALPTVVRLIGTSAVPSFAPSLIAISAAGLFVSALVLQSRREEDEEAIEEMSIEDDETAVSPVIATILMVAITVVLSGVIYVWAASLADTDVKGVPRMTFDMDSSRALDGENGHHRIAISSSQVDLATQAIDVRVQWSMNGALMNENYNLADPAIYGFGMDNTDTSTMVTFVDSVDTEKGATKSTFNTGDTIFIRTMDADGNTIEGMTVTITYNPGQGQPGAVLRQWTGL
ncbi:MAG TPA: type IV pilin [Candidatus Poseidoniales archaeon]|nr:type IV pilin [Candidatus Poseidoniales archaeon]